MKISKEKKDKICEQILNFLYIINPKSSFTSHIAKEIARDEEFTKKLLFVLKSKKLVSEIKKNSNGNLYSRRIRWKMSDKAYQAYKNHQNNKSSP